MAAFERAARQLVLLGAGLDTCAYRSRLSAEGLQIFEVDHPATAKLRALGFAEIEDIGPCQNAERYFPIAAGTLPDKGSHILQATTR